MVCVEFGAAIAWPYAEKKAVDDESDNTHTAAKQNNRDRRSRPMRRRGCWLGTTLAATTKLVNRGIGILFFAYERRRVGAEDCHELVSELSFLC